jgi:branched-chain amino acid transport system permease protein
VIAGSVYALTAFGFTIVYGTMRFFNLAHGSTYMIGAYMAYVFCVSLGLSLPVAIPFACFATMVVMMIFDWAVFRPLRQRHAHGWVIAICSFAVGLFIEPVISLIFGTDILSIRQIGVSSIYEYKGVVITKNQIIILTVSIILMILLSLFLQKTSFGKAMRATANDPEMADAIGIDVNGIFMMAMVLGAGLAGAAGALVSLEVDMDPRMGHSALLKAIVASILGGIGNITGAMFGGFFLGIVENFGIWKIESTWKDGISLAIMMGFILLKPWIKHRRGNR